VIEGFAQRLGNGTQKAHSESQKAQKTNPFALLVVRSRFCCAEPFHPALRHRIKTIVESESGNSFASQPIHVEQRTFAALKSGSPARIHFPDALPRRRRLNHSYVLTVMRVASFSEGPATLTS
jgi:hypothetical protein